MNQHSISFQLEPQHTLRRNYLLAKYSNNEHTKSDWIKETCNGRSDILSTPMDQVLESIVDSNDPMCKVEDTIEHLNHVKYPEDENSFWKVLKDARDDHKYRGKCLFSLQDFVWVVFMLY